MCVNGFITSPENHSVGKANVTLLRHPRCGQLETGSAQTEWSGFLWFRTFYWGKH